MTDETTVSKPDTPRSIFALSKDDAQALLADLKQPSFRASQLLSWVYEHRVASFEEMTNLPASLRESLANDHTIYGSTVLSQQSSEDGTVKLLLQWPDGATSECVLIPGDERRTACISSQVGCPVGCVFCASGLNGLQRQLTGGEIIEQAMRIQALCHAEGDRLTNVVFMGLGEPLANYGPTLHAVRTINAPWGMEIGARKITISTVGLPSQIRRLAEERIQVTLAISLHAPNDNLRQQIIPWAERVSVAELIEAAGYYFQTTGREVTLEYILLGGLNDQKKHAYELVRIARKIRSNVNLIAYNPVDGLPYERPSDQSTQHFERILLDAGINAHLRRSRGLDIDAACGQLRRRHEQHDTVVNEETGGDTP